MPTLEKLQRKIDSAKELKTVAGTMKSLAAVSIRQYERAVDSLEDFRKTIDTGLQIALNEYEPQDIGGWPSKIEKLGVVVFGSDRGMCGQFNKRIVDHSLSTLSQFDVDYDKVTMMAVGQLAADLLENEDWQIEKQIRVPTSVEGITFRVTEMLETIDGWRMQRDLNHIIVFHNSYDNTSYYPTNIWLLPLDPDWLKDLASRQWDGNTLPMYTLDWERLFSALVQRYIFVSLYQSFAESLAGENASRLQSMEAAEKNIDDRLDELNTRFQSVRQASITEELLDIIGGFEALSEDERR